MDTESDRSASIGRRTLLRGAGAAVVLMAAGGAWRAEKRGVFNPNRGEAFEPWENWNAEGATVATRLVSAAILASNAHNAQPWRFRLDGSRIDLFTDARRDIGTIDPLAREMHIGLGCALENLLLAARAMGYGHQLVLVPEPSDSAHVASVDLFPAEAAASRLYAAIPFRHTNRYAFATDRRLAGHTLDALGALNDTPDVRVLWFTSPAQCTAFAELLVGAAKAINADTQQAYDNGPRWLRQSPEEIAHYRDGLTLNTIGLSGAELLPAEMLPTPSLQSAGESWLASLREQAATAGAFGVLAVREDWDCAQRIVAGRLWQRMHLWTVGEGLAAQPMNQLHERADRESQLGQPTEYGGALSDIVGDPEWRAVFSFRIGHPTRPAPPSPRRDVATVIA